MTLPVGDYIVASETIVERKSTYDLVSSVFDGRLFDQCSRLREHFGHPVLVVEGNVDDLANITENPMVFYGALSRVALDYGIPVVPTPDAAHTAKLLVSMAAQKRSKPGPFLKKIRKHNDVARQQLSVLCSLPGVGETLASRMLERFGNPLAALEASATGPGQGTWPGPVPGGPHTPHAGQGRCRVHRRGAEQAPRIAWKFCPLANTPQDIHHRSKGTPYAGERFCRTITETLCGYIPRGNASLHGPCGLPATGRRVRGFCNAAGRQITGRGPRPGNAAVLNILDVHLVLCSTILGVMQWRARHDIVRVCTQPGRGAHAPFGRHLRRHGVRMYRLYRIPPRGAPIFAGIFGAGSYQAKHG